MTTPLQTKTLPPSIITPPASTSNANTYTDPNGLAALKKDPNSPQAIKAVAQQVDALFMQMMLKSMRDASAASGESDSNEMGMYQDMFDKQIALNLSQHQGLGLGTLLTRRLGGPSTPILPAPTAAKSAGGVPAAAADCTRFVSSAVVSRSIASKPRQMRERLLVAVHAQRAIVATARQRRHRLAGIQKSERIKCLFDGVKHLNLGGAELFAHGSKLLHAATVLAGHCAAHRHAQLEDATAALLGARELLGLAGIKHDERMQVAIAGVEDVRDRQLIFG